MKSSCFLLLFYWRPNGPFWPNYRDPSYTKKSIRLNCRKDIERVQKREGREFQTKEPTKRGDTLPGRLFTWGIVCVGVCVCERERERRLSTSNRVRAVQMGSDIRLTAQQRT